MGTLLEVFSDQGAEVDEEFVQSVVKNLARLGFPASEGYYLVLVSPGQARGLREKLRTRAVQPYQAHRHPPRAILDTMHRVGARYVCTLGDAVVAASRC